MKEKDDGIIVDVGTEIGYVNCPSYGSTMLYRQGYVSCTKCSKVGAMARRFSLNYIGSDGNVGVQLF